MNKVLVLLISIFFIGPIWAQHVPDSTDYGHVAIVSGLSDGSFRRAMDPGKSYAIGFETEGKTTIQAWQLEGRFAYRKQTNEDVLFSGVLDPYNGNPFVWGDTISGKWEHNALDSHVDLTFPKVNNHLFGLSIDYKNATGARNNGPKPFYRYRNININPRVKTFLKGREDHFIVIGLSYTSAFEENEIGYYSTNDTYLIRGRGYGSALKGPIQSLDRRRVSDRFGLNLNWSYVDTWEISLGSQYRKDNIKDGLANPSEDGNYTEILGVGEINYTSSNAAYGLLLNYRTGSTDDAVFGFENSEHHQYSALFSIDLDQKHQRFLIPEITIGLFYHKLEDHIVYSDYESQNLTGQLAQVNHVGNIKISWNIGYQYNLDQQSSVLAPDVLSDLIYTPDFEYMTSDHLFIGLHPTIPLGRVNNGKNKFFIKLKNNLLVKSTSSIRYMGELALGINL